MKITTPTSVFVGILSVAAAAGAKDIPLEIHWGGAEPSEVILNVPGGLQPLRRDAQAAVFRGSISVPTGKPERRTVTVRYGAFSHPFDFRVHRGLPRVTFFVSHRKQGSCTQTRVSSAAIAPDNLVDAVSRSVAAGELINIPEPNACDSDLRFRALRARFHQNTKMVELSNGFFLINQDVERQYRQEAQARGLSVDREVAAFIKQDQQYEARQLLVFRYAAQAAGNYDLALDVNNLIGTRITADPDAAALYQRQGVTEASLVTYARGLEVQAAAERREDDKQEPQ